MYIHEYDNWHNFVWNNDKINILLDKVCREQGKLYGRLSGLGFNNQLHAMAENLTRDVVYSSEIEGIKLNMDEVRSSIARRLGIDGYIQQTSRYVDAVVEVMLDAIKNHEKPITKEKNVRYGRICLLQKKNYVAGNLHFSQWDLVMEYILKSEDIEHMKNMLYRDI